MRKFKRLTGIAAITVGLVVLSAMLVWLAIYFGARGVDLAALRASFGPEFGYWGPVLLLAVPGLLLVFHGKRMLRDAPVSLLELFEVSGLLVIVAVLFFLVTQ
jgi:hypothetical protein